MPLIVAALLMISSVLVACSGHGEPDVSAEQCASAVSLRFGTLQDLEPNGQLAEADSWRPMSTGPASVAGVPGGCANGAVYSFEQGALPPGMSMDASSGVISGTPTEPGVYEVTVSATGPLLPDKVRLDVLQFQVRDPGTFAWTGWDDGAGGGHAVPEGASSMNEVGGKLVLTFGGTSAVTTMSSADGGASWTTDTPPAAPQKRQNFAVADDGAGHLYIAGGTGDAGPLGDVWMFDGNTWQQQTSQAPFGELRYGQLFFAAGRLFLFADGGQGHTLWRSDDSGRTWIKLSDAPFGQLVIEQVTCGVEFGGIPVVITADPPYGTGSHPYARVWSSPDDGLTWNEHTSAAAPGSPFTTVNGGGRGQCAVSNGRLFVVGSTIGWWHTVVDLVSSSDLDHWDFQPRSNAFLSDWGLPGAVFLDGRLHLVFGTRLYTTQP